MNTVVKIENLVKRYGNLEALDHLDLEIREGEIFGLLGPNGSGKTTAINCILALLKYDSGQIRVFGREMRSDSYDSKRQIGVVMQNVAVFYELTVQENIDYFCGLYIDDKRQRKKYVEEAIAFAGLLNCRSMRARKLSGGLLRRLNIACGIAHQPKLIIMDEPTVAVDPQSRNTILEGIKRLNEKGSTVIYTSHYMEEVEQICTRIAILDKGRRIALGTKEELKKMIKTGETVTVEAVQLGEENLQQVRRLPGVYDMTYDAQVLKVRFTSAGGSLMTLLTCLQQENVPFGSVYAEPPTLNDVFLELTGTRLRDERGEVYAAVTKI